MMKCQEKLSKRLEEFSEAGQGHFPNLEIKEATIHDPPLSEEIVDDDDWSDCDGEEIPVPIPSLPDRGYGSAEHQQILLPSSFQSALLPTSLGEAQCIEIELRVAQANNTLKCLREAIGYKSFLYRRRLNAPQGTRDRYKLIGKKDTRALTMVYDGNAQGQRNIALPWFWNMAMADDSLGSTYMEQVYRVNWLRAKARYDRCRKSIP
ncbi:uncharacterized protein LACBIDRAFT_312547 [Laccaria bicolor S238N-H82]|uniref:Predicted protein n=2 Tax=Laccaria bicolor (strain S238N-H82 / ATCC MYA-4686) TaxID=486041 RepID=B0DWD0_LACBS|nr:uncharacterized protein LACBIDRAFT_312547 [Laccaria bicolor S238N-H82]EDR01029.1 predicted protein [Laccaria bicolor S238N-H82]|eukprot:XP_001888248.1 predicted protein [Laccaria bicolor S238N-H82]